MRKNHHCTLVWTICFHEIGSAHGTLTLFAFTVLWHSYGIPFCRLAQMFFALTKGQRSKCQLCILVTMIICSSSTRLTPNSCGLVAQRHSITASRGAGLAQWWEYSPPTDVARVRFWARTICGLSLLLVLFSVPRGFPPGTPVFPSLQKPALLQIPMRPGMLERITHEAWETG